MREELGFALVILSAGISVSLMLWTCQGGGQDRPAPCPVCFPDGGAQ